MNFKDSQESRSTKSNLKTCWASNSKYVTYYSFIAPQLSSEVVFLFPWRLNFIAGNTISVVNWDTPNKAASQVVVSWNFRFDSLELAVIFFL